MKRRGSGPCWLLILSAALNASAHAHSASDAYVTLTAQDSAPPGKPRNTVVSGQWDIALRDLDFVLGLDDDGDGNIRWRELRAHQAEITRYAYTYLRLSAESKPCVVVPTGQKVAYHSDGAYAALFFEADCDGAAKQLSLDYRLFFAVDPSHRGILVLRSRDNLATSVLSPENTRIDLDL